MILSENAFNGDELTKARQMFMCIRYLKICLAIDLSNMSNSDIMICILYFMQTNLTNMLHFCVIIIQ